MPTLGYQIETIMNIRESVIQKPPVSSSNSQSLDAVDRLSRLMDSKFRIPGTSIRFGLDPVFSPVPVLGDLVTYIISGMLVYVMKKHGASEKVYLPGPEAFLRPVGAYVLINY